MTDTGELVTHRGLSRCSTPAARRSSSIRATARPRAGADGSLRQGDQLVGALGLFNFDPGPNFVRFGNSGIVPPGEPEPVVDRIDVGVAQGFLEESNVNPVLEITRLIMVQRAFENGAAMIRDTESSYDEAIKTLGSK